SGRVEVFNGEFKRNLEKIVSILRKDWVRKFDNVLWVYRTVFKISIGMFLYQLVYGKVCYLSVELEYKVYWVIRFLNFDVKIAGEKRLFQLNELDEFWYAVYENVKVYKERVKKW
ncbi:hypothetical protein DF186_14370, partial [Enterococcus hirae]